MNLNWMTKYAIIINGDYLDTVRYVVPLSEAAIEREKTRIEREFGKWGDKVQMVKV